MTFSFGTAILLWSLEGHAVVAHDNERMLSHPASRFAGKPIHQRDVNLQPFHENHPEAKPTEGVTSRNKSNAATTVNVGCITVTGGFGQQVGELYNKSIDTSKTELRHDCFVNFSECRNGNQPRATA